MPNERIKTDEVRMESSKEEKLHTQGMEGSYRSGIEWLVRQKEMRRVKERLYDLHRLPEEVPLDRARLLQEIVDKLRRGKKDTV